MLTSKRLIGWIEGALEFEERGSGVVLSNNEAV